MTLEEARQYALSLPEVTEEPHFKLSSFRVRGKIFATVPPGEDSLRIFVDEQRREVALSMYPEFCEKLRWGKKIVGVRVALPLADSHEVSELLLAAWKVKAPKKLLNRVNAASQDSGDA